MNLCFIAPRIYPHFFGGAEIFNYYFIQKLNKKNSISLISYSEKNLKNIYIHKITKKRPVRYLTPLKIFFKIIIHRRIYDVLILSYMRSHWFNWIIYPVLKHIFKMKYVIIIHGGGLNKWKPYFPFQLAFNKADKIIGVSKRICQEYEKRTDRKDIVFIPPLLPFHKSNKKISQIKSKYGLPNKSNVILYVGSLKELKSPQSLLYAFNMIDREFIKRNGLYLIFVGDGPYRNKLNNESKYKARTHTTGNIPRNEIPDLYKIANIYVITSKFEGTPLSLLEAMFNELPIIGANSPGINSTIDDNYNCLLYNPNDIRGLSNKIIKLIKNHALQKQLSLKAKQTFHNKYSYKKMINNYQSIFEEINHEQ